MLEFLIALMEPPKGIDNSHYSLISYRMGFVDFVDDTSIKTAIEKWDGKKVEGMELKIFMDSGSNAPLSLMITNLSLATKEETLKKVFEECGAVKSVFITSNKSEPGTAKA